MAVSTVGPWARDKLDRLGKYLHAYTTILSTQQWCNGYFYIDAFAGPGEHEVRQKKSQFSEVQRALIDVAGFGNEQTEQRSFLAGSPRVALGVQPSFSSYVFVEKSKFRQKELEQLQSEFGASRKIFVRHGDCNEYLLHKVVNNPKLNWKSQRAVVFLDPFGMQVPWHTIAALGRTKAIEVFLNFPVGMAIQRLLLRRGEFNQQQRAKLDEYLGSSDWYREMYRTSKNLFGDEDEEKVEKSGKRLLGWYRDRLKAEFVYVSKGALIRNTRGAHLYYLLLATHNKTGCKIANDIFLSAGETV